MSRSTDCVQVEVSEGCQQRQDLEYNSNSGDPDVEFGGTEARNLLERKLLWKIDLRMSIMVLIYILNYVRFLVLLTVCMPLILMLNIIMID